MSYILDALRKSEQSRQNEKASPTLNARHGPMTEADGDKSGGDRLLWVGLSVFLGALVAWLLWDKWVTQPESSSKVEAISTAASESQAPSLRSAEALERGILSQEPIHSGSVASEPEVMVEKSPRLVESEPSPLDEAPAYLSGGGERAAMHEVTVATKRKTKTDDPQLQAFADSGAIIITPESNAERRRKLSTAQKDSTLFQADWRTLPRFNELPLSIQNRVPQMSITSHTYSSDGSFRSVIIGSQKYREGDRVQMLKLEQITEDGAVLGIDGHRFHEKAMVTWGGR